MDFTGNMFLQIQDTPVLEVQFISCKSHRDSLCVIRSKIYWRNSIFFFRNSERGWDQDVGY